MEGSYISPLAEGSTALVRWGFVYDYNDSEIGGYTSGEFLLRSDGKLLWRSGGSSTRFENGNPITVWKFGPWEKEEKWIGGSNSKACCKWLQSRGYDLCEASVCRIDKSSSEPSPGIPALAKYLPSLE